MQCAAGAMTAASAATGMRAWLATRNYSWLTAQRMRRLTAVIMFIALCAAATGSGSGVPPS